MRSTCAINKNPILHLLVGFLPNRMKRLTLLASIAAIAKKTKEPDQKTIHKLNTMLGLSTTGDDALKLPIHVSGLIWTNQEIIDGDINLLCKSCNSSPFLIESAERIVNALPEWFLYDDKQTVMADLIELFTKDEELFPSIAMYQKHA